MKKVILTISIVLVVALACVSMTACNNTATTQGQLRNILSDHNSESFEYDVCAKDADGNKIEGYDGMYNVTLKAYGEGAKIENFGSSDTNLENLSAGILVNGLLRVGTQTYETGCYFKLINGSSYMVLVQSAKGRRKGNFPSFRFVRRQKVLLHSHRKR